MRVMFIVLCVCGFTATAGLMIMLLFFGIRVNLGFKLKNGKTIPTEQLVPQSIYGWAVFVGVFGGTGLLIEGFLPQWYLLIPVCLLAAFMVNLIGRHFLSPFVKKLYYGKPPLPDDLEGFDAQATEHIDGDDYGRCKVKYNERSYYFDCISVNHTDIEKSETVTIITGRDNLLFVQKKDEIYNVLNEKTD